MEIRMPAPARRLVKAALVNWLPWSVLKCIRLDQI
jgi:hypothetical protein